jgi:hypothetical protein
MPETPTALPVGTHLGMLPNHLVSFGDYLQCQICVRLCALSESYCYCSGLQLPAVIIVRTCGYDHGGLHENN